MVACLVNISSVESAAGVGQERRELMKTIANTNQLIRAASKNGASNLGALNAQNLMLAAQKFI